MNKVTFTTIGFVFFILGILSIVLSLIGVKFSFLAFIDKPGALFGFLIRLLMVFGGVIIIALAQTNWSQEGEEDIGAVNS